MNLWLRLLKVLLMGFFRPRLGIDGESVLNFRVWPTDLDFNIHMTNSRYLALMDLGRVDLLLRCGMWRGMTRRKLQPVVGGATLRYRRPLLPFRRFSLRTRIVGWDAKWLFMEQVLECQGEMMCRALFKGAFVGADGVVPPRELVQDMGHAPISPALPRWVTELVAAEATRDMPPLSSVGEQTCVR